MVNSIMIAIGMIDSIFESLLINTSSSVGFIRCALPADATATANIPIKARTNSFL